MRILIKIKPTEDRLDKWLLTQLKNLSRNQVRKLINSSNIVVNSHSVDPDYELKKGDKVDINLPAPKPTDVKAENIPLKIVYEDRDLIVIDKPAGMVAHPTTGHLTGTLVNALLFYWDKLPQKNESLRPGIVHRLDKDTSGLIVVAKNEASLDALKQQFENREVKKTYLALAEGSFKTKAGTIKSGIARHPKNPLRFTASSSGKDAQTSYKVIWEKNGFSYLEIQPTTGRTHQIRVHLEALGHPLVGDKLYGGKMLLPRHFLHATSLELVQPTTGEKLVLHSPLPTDLQAFLDRLT